MFIDAFVIGVNAFIKLSDDLVCLTSNSLHTGHSTIDAKRYSYANGCSFTHRAFVDTQFGVARWVNN